jgi:hypothetical protein
MGTVMESEDTNPTPLHVDDSDSGSSQTTPATEPSDLKFARFLCVGNRGDLTFYAHLSSELVDSHTLVRMLVGVYDDKIRRRELADRESFVLISAVGDGAEIDDPWVSRPVASAEGARPEQQSCSSLPGPQEASARHVSLRLLGVRHMAFYAKPLGTQYLLTNFLALCETVGADGDLTLVDAVWSDRDPAERRVCSVKNRDTPRPLALRPFASLVTKALERCRYSLISWHPSAGFIRHFDPEIYHG